VRPQKKNIDVTAGNHLLRPRFYEPYRMFAPPLAYSVANTTTTLLVLATIEYPGTYVAKEEPDHSNAR
jgi:hypothetical protein